MGDAIKVEPGTKRVRGYLRGELLFDTTRPLLVWEAPFYPTYYIPADDVADVLVANGATRESKRLRTGESLDVKIAGETFERVALRYPDAPIEAIRNAVRFEWDALDEWLEEDEPVYVHPRDPYTRVDILASSRHVEVVIDGVKVADSNKPTILFETRLPPRFYLPISDLRMDLLRPTPTTTRCPYKGSANYWSVEVDDKTYDDLAWTYRTPLPESQKIAGLVAFYNEKVDLYVDGELQRRPRTKFS
jgi:uncharacterized protein (DUF427 family)